MPQKTKGKQPKHKNKNKEDRQAIKDKVDMTKKRDKIIDEEEESCAHSLRNGCSRAIESNPKPQLPNM